MAGLSIEQRAAAIADRLVPNRKARAEDPTLAGVIARQWQAAYEGARAAFTERGAA
ncbi:hypothetical protein [Sphingomonas sp. ABOLG]|uniref:hypothetical protein n=1 Tax=Sphingomonas sp. ABOLG TaxID=1985880 RepID=UPI0013DDF8CD|nr:hypothetical protein [Sphingomonas sp. ABOLG]